MRVNTTYYRPFRKTVCNMYQDERPMAALKAMCEIYERTD